MDAQAAYIHVLEAELARCHAIIDPRTPLEYEYDFAVLHPCAKCNSLYHVLPVTCHECNRKVIICTAHTDWTVAMCGLCTTTIRRCPSHNCTRLVRSPDNGHCEHCEDELTLCKSCDNKNPRACVTCAKPIAECWECRITQRNRCSACAKKSRNTS